MAKNKITQRSTAPSSDTPPLTPEPLLRSREIARRLDCSSRNIELLADRGIIRRIVLGPRCHRFLWSNVAESLGI